ncbi:PIN domain-like protein [Hypoxylon sp. FL0543]|nr:PIN domain-like protein [Hypoxylon sp. FL0543]
MNVQVIFVFDGPNKPWKRRPNGQNYSERNVAVLKELLDQLGVPRHEAPGEAEAECARLQALGVVDAVWSDDSDTFMFGCTTLVQFHKPEGSEFKSEDLVLVYTAESITSRSKLSREGLIMYAILVGCDYSDGLPSIGVSTLLALAKHPKFQEAATTLARSASNVQELSRWRAILFNMVKATFPSKNFTMPPSAFPDPKVLENCCSPKVSPDSKLTGLVADWFRSFGPDLLDRHLFLIRHFHSRKTKDWTAEYLVSIELNHRLREGVGNVDYGITEKTAIGPNGEATITVDPLLVIPEYSTLLHLDVGLPRQLGKINVTLLDCIMRRGLPHLVVKATKKTSRGRPKKTAPRDSAADRASSHKPQEGKAQSEPAAAANVLRRRGRPRKGSLACLAEDNNHSLPGLGSDPKGPASLTELPKAFSRTVNTSGDIAVFVEDEDDENRDPNEGQSRCKRQKVGAPLPADIEVVDLTEAD